MFKSFVHTMKVSGVQNNGGRRRRKTSNLLKYASLYFETIWEVNKWQNFHFLVNYPFNTDSLPKCNIILHWQSTHEQLLKLNITFSWPKPIFPTVLRFSQSIPHDMQFCDYMNTAFLLINRFIFRSQIGEDQSLFNSLLSILSQPTATFFPRVTVKRLIAGMLKLIKERTVGSPTGGSAVEESFPEARAQTIHYCPSPRLYSEKMS